MILKVEIHIREGIYPTGGVSRLTLNLTHLITETVNRELSDKGGELKKIEFTRGRRV